MLVKANVLDGNEGVLQNVRDLVEIRPVPIFHGREIGDLVPVHVVEVAGPIASCQLGHLQHGRGIHIGLPYPVYEAQAAEAHDDQSEQQELQGGKEYL